MLSFLRKTGGPISIKLLYLFYIYLRTLQATLNYHHLLLVNKYNGRGLMKTVTVERVVGEEKGHVVEERISMEA